MDIVKWKAITLRKENTKENMKRSKENDNESTEKSIAKRIFAPKIELAHWKISYSFWIRIRWGGAKVHQHFKWIDNSLFFSIESKWGKDLWTFESLNRDLPCSIGPLIAFQHKNSSQYVVWILELFSILFDL